MAERGCEILPLRERDLAEVVEIERRSFNDPWSPAAFRQEVRRERVGGYSRVLRADGRVRAYSIAGFVEDEAHLANLAVDATARRRGYARALMDDLLREAGRRRSVTIWLEVRVGNAGAIRLYESYGFAGVGIRKNYYVRDGEDALVMRLELPPRQEDGSGVVREPGKRPEGAGEKGHP